VDSPRTNSENPAAADWQGLGDLIAIGTERLTRPVEGVHRAITDRWAALAGPWGAPVRHVSRAFASPVYASIRLIGSGVGRTVGFVATTEAGSKHLRPLWKSRLGGGVQSFVNGLWGDEFERQQSQLSIEMSIRSEDGYPIGADARSLVEVFPEATPRLVVLLHGLGDTEDIWRPKEGKGALAETLIDHSFNPLLVRYNSGRSLADNGKDLSRLLEEVVGNWPIAVDDISLIGHSMGGLVARSCLLAAHHAGHRWRDRAGHIVTVGTPHLGAPIEKSVNWMSRGLAYATVSRPIGEFVNQRSAGIKDLRMGLKEDTDPAVEHHFVAGTVTSKPDRLLGRLVGDLVVPVRSATGASRKTPGSPGEVRVLGGRNHRDLIHDPSVHEEILIWLEA